MVNISITPVGGTLNNLFLKEKPPKKLLIFFGVLLFSVKMKIANLHQPVIAHTADTFLHFSLLQLGDKRCYILML